MGNDNVIGVHWKVNGENKWFNLIIKITGYKNLIFI